MTVVDDVTRECLALVADTSISGARVARELNRIVAMRGKPRTLVSDNGTELTSNAILAWAQDTSVAWRYIEPGKPTQNAFIERPYSGLCRKPGRLWKAGGPITTTGGRARG